MPEDGDRTDHQIPPNNHLVQSHLHRPVFALKLSIVYRSMFAQSSLIKKVNSGSLDRSTHSSYFIMCTGLGGGGDWCDDSWAQWPPAITLWLCPFMQQNVQWSKITWSSAVHRTETVPPVVVHQLSRLVRSSRSTDIQQQSGGGGGGSWRAYARIGTLSGYPKMF